MATEARFGCGVSFQAIAPRRQFKRKAENGEPGGLTGLASALTASTGENLETMVFDYGGRHSGRRH
ncbi:MAG: hypothetical protein ABWZ64_17430, partial [Xanthobacteraceae bacterium]